MPTLQQIITTLTAIVMTLSAQVGNLSQNINPQTQQGQVLGASTTGLVGYWNFDEGSGSTASDSAGSNTANLINGPTWTVGKFGQGLSLDGVNDYLVIGDPAVLKFGTGDFSASVWVNSSETDNFITIMDFTNNGSGGWRIEQIGALGWMDFVLPLNQRARFTGFTNGVWHHVVGVRSSGTISIYVDGVKGSDNTDASDVDASPNPLLGFSFGNGWTGKLDDIRLYSRALSSSEVLDIYNDTGTVTPPPPPSDTTAPSTPTSLTATAVSSSQINFTWSASTDNVAVTGYDIYRAGALLTTVTATNYSNTSLSPSTSYSYTVRAKDAAGNVSAQSSSASATTQAVATGASTFYIDYVNGSDSNNGTSKVTPWKSIPGMRSCISVCAGTVPKAGDKYILKGGVTWPNAALPILWNWSGTSGNPIYIGVDQTWYTGSSWTRPIFDGQKMAIVGTNVFFRGAADNATAYVTLESIEMKGLYSAGAGTWGNLSYVQGYNLISNWTFNNLYLHGWNVVTDGNCTIVSVAGPGNLFSNGIIDGSDMTGATPGSTCAAFYPGLIDIKNNIIHDLPNAIVGYSYNSGAVEISGNHIYNLKMSNSGSHPNAIETVAGGTYYIHDNVIHDHVGETMMLGNDNEIDYVWNNVIYNILGNVPELPQLSGVSNLTFMAWNNTIDAGGSGRPCFINSGGSGAFTTVTIQNNHCVATSATIGPSSWGITSKVATIDHNLLMTPAQATAAGYTFNQAFAFSPTSGTSATVGGGRVLSSNCSGSLASLCSDTNYANTRTPVARGSTWDIGAYQYSSGGSIIPPTPSPSTKFTTGQRIQTTSNLNVRATASATGTLLGTQSLNSFGTIVSGGTMADGYFWWNVNYDSGVDGYSVENYLTSYSAPIIGDFNSDGLVNSIDLSLLTSAWNTNNSTYDLNSDTIVNSLDYVIMVQNWSL